MRKILGALFVIFIAGFVVAFCIDPVHAKTESVDIVVFSYDRPLQLYALLESMHKYVRNTGKVSVIYRASNDRYERAYGVNKNDFPDVVFYKQGTNPAQDFKPLVIKTVFETPSAYVLFAVDDIVVKGSIDLDRCIAVLEKYGAYAFFLRLGLNLNYCYPLNCVQPVPKLTHEEQDVVSWRFCDGSCDWAYPHTVDMTLYRKCDIESDLKSLSYHTPNQFEGVWSGRARAVMERKGLCFANSKMVNLPLNRVQHDFNNRAMQISTQELLELFVAGKKMDIEKLSCIDNKSAHMEHVPTFITRINEKVGK